MATVTGKQSYKIDELVNGSIISGAINSSGQLILTTRGGDQINAGLVFRPVGDPWSSTVTYKNGDVVGFAGVMWRARSDNTNKPPALFTSIWTRLTGESFDDWAEKDPYFDGDDRTESWEFFWKTGAPVVSLTQNAGEFESGYQALKISMAASEAQRFYQKEENITRGGEVLVATVRARLVATSGAATLQGAIMQNNASGRPGPFETGLYSAFAAEGDQALTTSWATYTFTFTPTAGKPRTAINFIALAGGAAAVVLVDWVRIKRRQPIPLDAYPVGSLYLNVTNTNPGTFLGGTWVAFGTGRTLIGVDPGNTAFDTPEEVGGALTHIHNLDSANSVADIRIAPGDAIIGSRVRNVASRGLAVRGTLAANTTSSTVTSTVGAALDGDTVAASSLSPYITCYMWKRTA